MGTSSAVYAELVNDCCGSAGSFWLFFAGLFELQPELSEPKDNKYRRALAKWLKLWSYGKQNQTLNKRVSFLRAGLQEALPLSLLAAGPCRMRPAHVSPRLSQPRQRLCFCMHASRSIPRGLVCSTLCHCCWLFFLAGCAPKYPFAALQAVQAVLFLQLRENTGECLILVIRRTLRVMPLKLIRCRNKYLFWSCSTFYC